MPISFEKIEIEKIQVSNNGYERIKEYIGNDQYSEFEIGFIKFCYDYNSDITLNFGSKTITLELWHDVWDLLTLEIFFVLSKLRKQECMSFSFIDYECIISSCEYYENNVRLELSGYGSSTYCYYTECNLNKLINELIKLAKDVIAFAVKLEYVNSEEANKFLSRLD
jgi:hypothetical protein